MPVPLVLETFGDMLKYLRRKARLTQRELSLAVGYTEAHICRLEKNERLPDLTTVAALFVPALFLEDEPELIERLLKLAARSRSRQRPQPSSVTIQQVTIEHQVEQDLGALEDIPSRMAYYVPRPEMVRRVTAALSRERCVVLCGLPGMGKTSMAAAAARDFQPGPVFWHTLSQGVNTSVDAIIRQLALFFLALGQARVRPLVERSPDVRPMPLDQQLMLIRTALARCPALLCFDDAHLLIGNEASLSLLRHLSEIPTASLLLTSRQDVPLPAHNINVAGLEPGEARELVASLGLTLEPGILERLLDRTGCSPMLIRLAAGQLMESCTDTRSFVEHLEMQPQVSTYLLNAVLKDLAPATHWLAGLISVFRQPVDLYDETLVELIAREELPCCLPEAIAELQHRHLVDRVDHALLHPLVRDHLFTTLAANAALKKRLHRLAAEWSERALGDAIEAAYHWTCAGDEEQAAEILGSQSEQLFDHGQAHAAVQVVDVALEGARRRRSDTTSLRCTLFRARGDLLRGTLRAAEAEQSYREALALAQNLPAVRAQIVRNLAQVLMQRGQAAEGLRLVQSAIADLSPADTVLLARLASIEGRAHLTLSQYDEAERTAEVAITLANQFAEVMPQLADDVRARSERILGWVSYTRHPDGAASLEHYHRALACARRAGLSSIENAIHSNIATVLVEKGESDLALSSYQEALKGFEALGELYGTAAVLHNLGTLHFNRGEEEAALARFEQAAEIERLVGDVEGLLSTEEARASVYLSAGRLADARRVLDQVLAEDRGSADAWTIGSCLCLLAEVQLLQGEISAARSTGERVLAIPGAQDNARISAWAQSGLALALLAAGEIASARTVVAALPAEDLGAELTFRWRLVQCAVALAGGDVEGGKAIACSVAAAAAQKGFKPAIPVAEKIIANLGMPLQELLPLILTGK